MQFCSTMVSVCVLAAELVTTLSVSAVPDLITNLAVCEIARHYLTYVNYSTLIFTTRCYA